MLECWIRPPPETAAYYIRFLCRIIEQTKQYGLKPFILIHDDNEDIRVAHQLMNGLQESLSIVEEKSPIVLKGILSLPFFVIGSRFHALVSAFSQGVPCIGVGWSHKYEMLFKDYACQKFLISGDSSEQAIGENLEQLLNESERDQIVRRLKNAMQKQKEKTRAMWSQIDKLLGLN